MKKEDFESKVAFWMKTFSPRTKKWRSDTMRSLKAPKKAELQMPEEMEKIEALKRLK